MIAIDSKKDPVAFEPEQKAMSHEEWLNEWRTNGPVIKDGGKRSLRRFQSHMNGVPIDAGVISVVEAHTPLGTHAVVIENTDTATPIRKGVLSIDSSCRLGDNTSPPTIEWLEKLFAQLQESIDDSQYELSIKFKCSSKCPFYTRMAGSTSGLEVFYIRVFSAGTYVMLTPGIEVALQPTVPVLSPHRSSLFGFADWHFMLLSAHELNPQAVQRRVQLSKTAHVVDYYIGKDEENISDIQKHLIVFSDVYLAAIKTIKDWNSQWRNSTTLSIVNVDCQTPDKRVSNKKVPVRNGREWKVCNNAEKILLRICGSSLNINEVGSGFFFWGNKRFIVRRKGSQAPFCDSLAPRVYELARIFGGLLPPYVLVEIIGNLPEFANVRHQDLVRLCVNYQKSLKRVNRRRQTDERIKRRVGSNVQIAEAFKQLELASLRQLK